MKHIFRVENIDQCGSNWLLWTKKCIFDPKILIFGAKSQFFCFRIVIFVTRAYHQYTRGYNNPIRKNPQKIFCFQAMGLFSGLTPFFGRFGLVSLRYYMYP